MTDFTIPTKQCRKCKEWKPATPEYFHKCAPSKDGLQPTCKQCRTKKERSRPQSVIVDSHKLCTKCNRFLPATTEYFNRSKANKTGFSSQCKACFIEHYSPRVGDSRPHAPRGKSVTLFCAECGQVFSRKPSAAKKRDIHYCSRQCAYKGYGKRYSGENSPQYSTQQVPCTHCGALISRTSSHVERNTVGHFCNGECYGEWRIQNMIGESATRWTEKIATACLQCGNPISLTKSQVREPGNFCCHECYGKWRTDNLIGEDSPLWKGGRLPYYGISWKRQRKKARERDQHTCQHCGATKADLGRDLDVHHVIPFRLYGRDRHEEANHLSNLICLCKRCHGLAELRAYVPG